MKINIWASLSLLLLLVGCQKKEITSDTATDRDTNTVVRDADNTAQNVRDREESTLTPGDQGNSPADRETTQMIRKSLVNGPADYSLTAKNIKIITVNGKVTLRGPVGTEAEKLAIVAYAKTVAGADNVEDQLEVKANP